MLHEKAGKGGTRNRGRYQVAQRLIEQTLIVKFCQQSSLTFFQPTISNKEADGVHSSE